MALIIYNTKRQRPYRSPFISFSRLGAISLNKTAAKIINVNPGDCIEFAQDETEKADWFIRKCKQSDYKLRFNSSGSLVCNGQDICKHINHDTSFTERTVQYGISESANEDGWIAIITSKTKII